MRKKRSRKTGSKEGTTNDKVTQRARIVLAVSLSKLSSEALTRIIMDWVEDSDLEEFCRAYLDETDLALIGWK
jgi:hypothetical protein